MRAQSIPDTAVGGLLRPERAFGVALKEEFPCRSCRVERPFGSQTLILETGKLAKQAHGAVVVQLRRHRHPGRRRRGRGRSTGRDFFPLIVDYREKTYAAGKFPGGFIKREGRPTTKEILTSRLIDRPIRPLFPAGYINEVQIMASTLSADRENDPDMLSHDRRQRRPARLADPVPAADRRRPRRPHRRRVHRSCRRTRSWKRATST